jgi:hypothetical protein
VVARYLNFTTFVSVCSQFGHLRLPLLAYNRVSNYMRRRLAAI